MEIEYDILEGRDSDFVHLMGLQSSLSLLPVTGVSS